MNGETPKRVLNASRQRGGRFSWDLYQSSVLKLILFYKGTNNLDKDGGDTIIKFAYDCNEKTINISIYNPPLAKEKETFA